ncbi:MAG: fucose isomerase [Phycisphaerae bacterium]|nr:fucose isomerase [Phycisphaerae bacterium]
MAKQTFGVIVTSRNIFPGALAVDARKKITAVLASMGHECIMVAEGAVDNGAIETFQDAKKCAELFQSNRDRIDGIIVILPNFGDEQGVVAAVDMAELKVPVLVQACSDETTSLELAGRRDAFCGKLSVCNNLYQYGIAFTNTQLHTCSIESEAFARDIARFAGVCRVVRGLRRARIGAIGARPEAFHTVRFSEKLLQASGIQVVTVDLSDIFAAANRLGDAHSDVQARIKAIRNYGAIPADTPQADVLRQAKLCTAVEQWLTENECVASAIQCWTSIQNNYGCAACLSMSMMGEAGRPSACEMDIAGAVSMLALNLASGGVPSGFVDWNNNYLEEQDKCVVTHCSNYPKSFMGADVEISRLDILGQSLGAERCFGGIKGRLAAGPFTYARISTDDTRGTIKAYVGSGDFTDDPLECNGGVGVCRIPRLQHLLDHLCRAGFEHHVAMNRSRCADILHEAFSRYLGWDVYHHAAVKSEPAD